MSEPSFTTLNSPCYPPTSPLNASCNYTPGSINPQTGEVEFNYYGYNVDWAAYLFVAVFGLITISHLALAIYARQRFLFLTFIPGGIGETIGWAGRVWSKVGTKWLAVDGGAWWSPDTAFMMQIASLIISPAFIQGGLYVLLGRIIPVLGSRYSFIHPLSYTIVFVFGDVVSLVIQAIGGGSAAAAETGEDADRGARVMVGGVIIQLIIMIAYTLVLLTFVWRWKNDKPVRKQIELFSWWPQGLRTKSYKRPSATTSTSTSTSTSTPTTTGQVTRSNSEVGMISSNQSTRVNSGLDEKVGGFGNSTGLGGGASDKEIKGAKKLLTACLVATLLIFIRSVYRTVELLDGWDGKIITNQTLFNILDGLLIVLALGVFVVVHPGLFLPRRDRVRRGGKV